MSQFQKLVSRFNLKGLGEVVRPENAKWRKLTAKHSAAAAAAQTFEFELKSRKLIHKILISIGESTTATGDTEQGTLADDITSITLEAPSGVLKYMTGTMNKALGILTAGKALSTGFYEVTFSDPSIPDAMPLPGWIFEPLLLKIVDNAPAASNYHHIFVSVLESFVPQGVDISRWRILYEKYLKDMSYGASTGYQEYQHSLSRFAMGYLYEMDDNGSLSNTIYDRLKVVGEKPGGEHVPVDEQWISHIREENARVAQVDLPTGFIYLSFPEGYDSGQYKELKSQVNIPSAGTDAGLRVLERYLL